MTLQKSGSVWSLRLVISLFSLCFFIVSFSLFLYSHTSKELEVVFADVGQGDGIVIKTPSGKIMVIDGGPGITIQKAVNKKAQFFKRDIDVLLSTHPDADHITGLMPLLENFFVKTITVSPAKGETNLFSSFQTVTEVELRDGAFLHIGNSGDSIDFGDGVKVYLMTPSDEYWNGEDTNDESISTLITYGSHSFLLTGDLPTKKENLLFKSNFLPKGVTVYKAGHHGSKDSSGEVLLSYIKPFYSVISAGKDNRYGHPHPDTLKRLEKHSKVILSTIDSGDITFITDGKNLSFKTSK
jgi:beta-lactamase superfamily II metal-dependent hydrolase